MALALRDTVELNLVGLTTIPLWAFITPRVAQNDATATRVRIPLGYRTRNHMGSMYFGVLCAGADAALGLAVVRLMRARQANVVPSFKSMRADFLRRPDGDVEFRNDSVAQIAEAFERALTTGERVNLEVTCTALLAKTREPVATFTALLSMKHKPGKLPLSQRILAML